MWITPEDALRAMEEIAIANNLADARRYRAEADMMEQACLELNRRNTVIQERNAQLAQTRQELTALGNYNFDHLFAADKTLNQVIRDFAKVSGIPEADLRKRYNVLRTQHFNRQINESISKGIYKEDPRVHLSERVREWYVPGLDADHGF